MWINCECLGRHLKKDENIEEEFDEILYTKVEKEKKRKVTKKIGRKHVLDKNKRKSKDKEMDSRNKLDSMDISAGEGADTLNTTENKKKKKQKKSVEWSKPKRNPSSQEQRKMFGKALEILLISCMNKNIYSFENHTRIQKQGGPIGIKLTREIADCLVIDWAIIEKVKRV